MVTVRELGSEDWDRQVAAFPGSTVFHRSAWLEAVAAGYRLKLFRLTAEVDGRSAGLLPCFEWRFGPLRALGSPLPATSTVYLGPLLHDGPEREAVLGALLGDARLCHHAFFACRVLDRGRALDLAPLGFTPTRRFETCWIDLRQSEDELWRRMKSECRNRVRKAERLGVEVRREAGASFIDEFWQMTLETFERSGGRPTHNRRVVAEVCAHLEPLGQLDVWSAFVDGRRVATLMLPHDTKTLYYWAGAACERDRSVPAGNLLHWEAIRAARRQGLSGYDLVSATGGPGRFKRSLGAELLQTATHWERISWRPIAVLKRWFDRRRARRHAGAPENRGAH